MPFFVFFIILPLLEIMVFFEVGDEIGYGVAFLLLLLSGFAGFFILKYHGFLTMQALQNAIRQGRSPAPEIFDSFCLIIAGLAFIIPGFLSDFIGLLLLLAPVRTALRNHLAKKETARQSASFEPDFNQNYQGRHESVHDSGVIEGEYTRLEDEPDKRS